MSLDVSLKIKSQKFADWKLCREFALIGAENQSPKVINAVDTFFQDIKPDEYEEIYDANITHNLNEMANEAGIYKHLWRPEEVGITTAKELIKPLTDALDKLRKNPEFYKKFNPHNGWGTYNGLVAFVEQYLSACTENPEAIVTVSR